MKRENACFHPAMKKSLREKIKDVDVTTPHAEIVYLIETFARTLNCDCPDMVKH